jgi:hypothetical protein
MQFIYKLFINAYWHYRNINTKVGVYNLATEMHLDNTSKNTNLIWIVKNSVYTGYLNRISQYIKIFLSPCTNVKYIP